MRDGETESSTRNCVFLADHFINSGVSATVSFRLFMLLFY